MTFVKKKRARVRVVAPVLAPEWKFMQIDGEKKNV